MNIGHPSVIGYPEKYVRELEQRNAKLVDALEAVKQIVHTPTKKTMFKNPQDHFQSDFDRIRKIISDNL